MVLYGSIIWWHRADRDYLKRRLVRLQRLACLMITGCFKSTPTAAIEASINLLPLQMAVQSEALASYKRIKRYDLWIDGSDHRNIAGLASLVPELDMPEDRRQKHIQLLRNFSVKILDRNSANIAHDIAVAGDGQGVISCFTDGSKTAGLNWSGAGIYIKDMDYRESISLGTFPTVFQTEVYAIKECACCLSAGGYSGKSVWIFSDSQAALKSLQRYTVKSSLVLDCINALNNLSTNNMVTLSWIPGHSGVFGNNIADNLARRGSDNAFTGPEPAIGIGPSIISAGIKRCFSNKHLSFWTNINGCRIAKQIIKEPNQNLAIRLLACSRLNLRVLMGIYTDHTGLRNHLHRMGLSDSPLCTLCGEDVESSVHIYCDCPALENLRYLFFGNINLNPGDLADRPPCTLIGFGRASGLWQSLTGQI